MQYYSTSQFEGSTSFQLSNPFAKKTTEAIVLLNCEEKYIRIVKFLKAIQ